MDVMRSEWRPHEVGDDRGDVCRRDHLRGGRFGNDQVSCRTWNVTSASFRIGWWAIEGCNGISHHAAMRLLTAGEEVADVPPKFVGSSPSVRDRPGR